MIFFLSNLWICKNIKPKILSTARIVEWTNFEIDSLINIWFQLFMLYEIDFRFIPSDPVCFGKLSHFD